MLSHCPIFFSSGCFLSRQQLYQTPMHMGMCENLWLSINFVGMTLRQYQLFWGEGYQGFAHSHIYQHLRDFWDKYGSVNLKWQFTLIFPCRMLFGEQNMQFHLGDNGFDRQKWKIISNKLDLCWIIRGVPPTEICLIMFAFTK